MIRFTQNSFFGFLVFCIGCNLYGAYEAANVMLICMVVSAVLLVFFLAVKTTPDIRKPRKEEVIIAFKNMALVGIVLAVIFLFLLFSTFNMILGLI